LPMLAISLVSWGNETAPSAQGVTELIVKFNRSGLSVVDPRYAITVVQSSAQGTGPTDATLYTRLGSPVGARWLIENRLPAEYIQTLRTSNPEHPEIHLQEYVVLRYQDAFQRSAAQTKFKADAAIRSATPNDRMNFSTRVN